MENKTKFLIGAKENFDRILADNIDFDAETNDFSLFYASSEIMNAYFNEHSHSEEELNSIYSCLLSGLCFCTKLFCEEAQKAFSEDEAANAVSPEDIRVFDQVLNQMITFYESSASVLSVYIADTLRDLQILIDDCVSA